MLEIPKWIALLKEMDDFKFHPHLAFWTTAERQRTFSKNRFYAVVKELETAEYVRCEYSNANGDAKVLKVALQPKGRRLIRALYP
jgi:hypothetical protein